MLFEYNNKQNEKIDVGNKHHEQIPSVQKKFINNVESLCYEFENAGNPFSETSNDLYALDTKNIMSDIVKNSVESAENIGKTQFDTFLSERIFENRTPFFNNILKNNFPLFNSVVDKKKPKLTTKISILNSDVNLFSRLYIVSQAREVDMDNFFVHEYHPWPPSLASNGIMNTTSKSDLIGCFQNVVPFEETMPTVDAKVVDGAELIQTLDSKKSISHAPINTF